MKSFVILGVLLACLALSDALVCFGRFAEEWCRVNSHCEGGLKPHCTHTNGKCACQETNTKICNDASHCGSGPCKVHLFGKSSQEGHWHCDTVTNSCICDFNR
uniref:Uncharacterized protein n=1 Tax=Pinctada fucata TaxID=50426 RepID=A0A194AL86_PINFU